MKVWRPAKTLGDEEIQLITELISEYQGNALSAFKDDRNPIKNKQKFYTFVRENWIKQNVKLKKLQEDGQKGGNSSLVLENNYFEILKGNILNLEDEELKILLKECKIFHLTKDFSSFEESGELLKKTLETFILQNSESLSNLIKDDIIRRWEN